MSHCKEPELTGRIVLPGERPYGDARQEFNTFFNRFPRVIVFVQETQDVINALLWARHHDVPIRIRSGRHSYEGLSVVDCGLVIDVSDMTQVEVDRRSGTATVQTGIRNFALYEALGAEGLVVPSGICPTPGIGGVSLGGGHSILSRPYGLTIDHLIGLEMVDADGHVITTNADHNADLFWASRGGGGGNFGVCTSYRFRTHCIETVGFAEISWDLQDLEAVLRTWQDYTTPCADERFTSTLGIAAGEQSSMLMQGVFLGSVRELCHLLQPLLRAGSPQKVTIEEIPWLEAVSLISAQQPASPQPFKSVASYIYDPLPDSGIATIRHFIDRLPDSSIASILFQSVGGAVAKVPSHATAYFYRQAQSVMQPWITWTNPDAAVPGIHWVEEFRLAMLPFTHGVYVNTPDLSIKDWPEAYYGSNFERLTKVKAKYDPENVFQFPQSIPPSH